MLLTLRSRLFINYTSFKLQIKFYYFLFSPQEKNKPQTKTITNQRNPSHPNKKKNKTKTNQPICILFMEIPCNNVQMYVQIACIILLVTFQQAEFLAFYVRLQYFKQIWQVFLNSIYPQILLSISKR